MLIGENLCVRYNQVDQPALDSVSVRLVPGQRHALLGPSGAGRSTLLRVLAGLQQADEGRISRNGWMPSTRKDWQRWCREIAMVFQDHGVIPRKTVLWHALLGHLGRRSVWRAAWFTPAADIDAAFAALNSVGLRELSHRRVRDCSGGQRQRVGIARALVQQADVLLADEPIANLDPHTASEVLDLITNFVAGTADEPRCAVVGLHQVTTARHWA